MGHCSSIYRALHIIFKKQTKKKAKAHHPFPLCGPCFASSFVRFTGRMNVMVHLRTGECCAFTDVTLVKSRLNVVTSFARWRRCKTCRQCALRLSNLRILNSPILGQQCQNAQLGEKKFSQCLLHTARVILEKVTRKFFSFIRLLGADKPFLGWKRSFKRQLSIFGFVSPLILLQARTRIASFLHGSWQTGESSSYSAEDSKGKQV